MTAETSDRPTVSELISRDQAVIAAAREFMKARAVFVDLHASRRHRGRAIAAARQARDAAIYKLVAAVKELDG